MKKPINLKMAIIAVTALVAVALAITLLVVHGATKTSAGDAPEKIVLKAGTYMSTNGDKDMYVKVFEDNTIQIFGLPYCEYTLDYNDKIGMSKDWTEEFREQTKKELMEEEEFFKQRFSYEIVPQAKLILFKETSTGLGYVDENTLKFNDDFVYVYSEE